jgi:hypothetical protein
MLSKPVAFGLLVVACVAAAGGGAYIATLQHARSDAEPQPIGVMGTGATITQPPLPVADQPAQLAASVPPVALPAPPAQATPRTATTGMAVEESQSPLKSARGTSSAPSSFVPSPPPKAVESPAAASPALVLPSPFSQGVDPGPAQRPWPGLPISQPMVPTLAAEPARTESDMPVHDGEKLWLEVVVPAESVLGLQLESSISTEFARVEDRVDARVTRDVRVAGRAAIPAGTHAIGTVVMVERGGRVKERARIGIRFNTLVLADASRLAITTDTVYREGESPANQSSAKIGGAAIGGAIIGAILGGGKGAAIGSGIGAAGGAAAAMNGDRHPVVLTAGTTLSVRTQAPVSVNVEK